MHYEYFEENKEGSDYVVSDIHGCYSLLELELKRIGFDRSVDRLFCVGDLTDRGPENEEVLEWLEYPWFFSIMGNHEDMIIRAFDNTELMFSMAFYAERNGNTWWLELPIEKQKVYVDAFKNLPHIIEIEVGEKYIGLVHAELPMTPEGDWRYFINTKYDQILNKMIWSRDIVRASKSSTTLSLVKPVEGIDLVIHGHTVIKEPMQITNRLYIDTGAVFTGKFTILKLKDLI